MRTTIVVGLLLAGFLVSGCVSRFTYKQMQDELAAAQREQKATAARLQATQQKVGELQQALRASRQDREDQLRTLREQLEAATKAAEQAQTATQQERETAEKTKRELQEQIQRLEQEQTARQDLERQMRTLRDEADQAKQREQELAQQAAAAPPPAEVVPEVMPTSEPDGRITFSIIASLLFKSGDSQISPEGRAILVRLKDTLAQVSDARIQVEGHTDNKPLKATLQKRYRSNWELSTARATSVVRFLVMEAGVKPELLSAVGYADTRPVASNDTEEGRQQNRRIEIVLYPGEPPSLVDQAANSK